MSINEISDFDQLLHAHIRMKWYKNTFGSLGFDGVVTYIQSGNVFFSCNESDARELEDTIGQAIRDEYGFDVPVMVRTSEELSRIVEQNPFKDLSEDSRKLFVAFLASQPDDQNVVALTSQSNERESFAVTGDQAFISVDRAYKGKIRFSNGFIEKQLKVKATTRNIKVTRRLAEISGESST